MPALLALAPVIIQGILMVLKWVGEKFIADKEKEKFYNVLTEMARVLNLPDLVKKFEMAEQQLNKNKSKWDEIERQEKENKK